MSQWYSSPEIVLIAAAIVSGSLPGCMRPGIRPAPNKAVGMKATSKQTLHPGESGSRGVEGDSSPKSALVLPPYDEPGVAAILRQLARCNLSGLPEQSLERRLREAQGLMEHVACCPPQDVREAEERVYFSRCRRDDQSSHDEDTLYALNRYLFRVPHWVSEKEAPLFRCESPTVQNGAVDELHPWSLAPGGTLTLTMINLHGCDSTWAYRPADEFDYFLRRYGFRATIPGLTPALRNGKRNPHLVPPGMGEVIRKWYKVWHDRKSKQIQRVCA